MVYLDIKMMIASSGSDLDGDEYSVIWDKKLMFIRNENPLDFTKRMRKYEEVGTDKVVSDFQFS